MPSGAHTNAMSRPVNVAKRAVTACLLGSDVPDGVDQTRENDEREGQGRHGAKQTKADES
jgi:hypothetical protein